jgi:hypothetical protein
MAASPLNIFIDFPCNLHTWLPDYGHQVFGGTAHLQEDKTQLGVLTRQGCQNYLLYNRGQNNKAIFTSDINLV